MATCSRPAMRSASAATRETARSPMFTLQVTDSIDWPSERGLPMAFRRSHHAGAAVLEGPWMPAESEAVDGGSFG
jgi:hypothetical protein